MSRCSRESLAHATDVVTIVNFNILRKQRLKSNRINKLSLKTRFIYKINIRLPWTTFLSHFFSRVRIVRIFKTDIIEL